MCEFVCTRGPGRLSKVHRKRAIDTNVGTELFVRVKLEPRCLGALSGVKDVLIVELARSFSYFICSFKSFMVSFKLYIDTYLSRIRNYYSYFFYIFISIQYTNIYIREY